MRSRSSFPGTRGMWLGWRRPKRGDVRAEVDTLRRDVQRLGDDLTDLVRALREAGRESTTAASTSLRRQLDDRLDRLSDTYASMRRRSDEAVDTLREHPIASVSGAVVAGALLAAVAMLLSALLRR